MILMQKSESGNCLRAFSPKFEFSQPQNGREATTTFSGPGGSFWTGITDPKPLRFCLHIFYQGGVQQRDLEGVNQGWDCVELEQASDAPPLPPPPLALLHLPGLARLHLGHPARQPALGAARRRAVA